MNGFGARLRNVRRQAGMSQVDAGGERYTGSYVSHLESGRRQPTRDVAEYLAARLGVSLADLLGSEPEAFVANTAAKDMMQADLNARAAWLEQDFEQAERDAGRAADAARRSGRIDSWWAASGLRAQALLAVGDYVQCWELAELLANHVVAQESGAMRAEMLVLASKARRAEGMLREAVQRAEAAIVYAAGPPATHGVLAHAYIAAISAMVEIGRTEETAPLADQLRVVRERVESAHTRGLIAWTLGNLDFVTGEVARASREHGMAGALLRPETNLRAWGRFRYSSASFHLAAGISQGVREQLEAASVALHLVGHSGDLCELDMAYAELAISEKAYPEALERLDAALADPSVLPGNRQGDLQVLRATVLCKLGQLSDARRAMAWAASKFEEAGAYRRALDVWRTHAEMLGSVSDEVQPVFGGPVLSGQP